DDQQDDHGIDEDGQVRPRVPLLVQALAILIDPVIVLLIVLASPEDTAWLRLFVPAVLFGLLHLGERLVQRDWRRSYADRVMLTALLIPAALFGVIQPAAAVLALGALVSLFLTAPPRD
ncbi:hypothetical protein, partial [Erythrobacter sp. HI0019]|uniref:hypothetical protein n=1 Tax=Erythrobacter sp. HI0019 TaxID=1822222 RepID=UPI000A6A7000